MNDASSPITLENTILGNNLNGSGVASDLLGDVITNGANLVESHFGVVLTGPAPITGDPHLAPRGAYGGRTESMPPLPGSPLIEGGVLLDSTPATDQLQHLRPRGPLPDLGAVEALAFGALALPSTDGDSIPDILEGFGTAYQHLDPALNDSALDTDHDGRTDAEEIADMTDPLDANDFFRILRIGPTATFSADNPLVEVTVSTFPGLSYEFETDATLANFQFLPDSTFTAEDFTENIEVLLAPGRDFVRCKRN